MLVALWGLTACGPSPSSEAALVSRFCTDVSGLLEAGWEARRKGIPKAEFQASSNDAILRLFRTYGEAGREVTDYALQRASGNLADVAYDEPMPQGPDEQASVIRGFRANCVLSLNR